MANSKSIVCPAPASTGWGQVFCHVNGRGYGIMLRTLAKYGPRQCVNREVVTILTSDEARQLAEDLEREADRMDDYLKSTPDAKAMESM